MAAGGPKLPVIQISTLGKATRARSDEQLLGSWLDSLNSAHTRRNFEVTARRFLAELPAGGLRAAAVEDVRDALARITQGVAVGRRNLIRLSCGMLIDMMEASKHWYSDDLSSLGASMPTHLSPVRRAPVVQSNDVGASG